VCGQKLWREIILKVGNRAVYLFLDGIFGLGLGYVFWIVVARLQGSAVTGETSSSITMAILLATVFTFGISIGSQRYLGKAFGEQNHQYFREISQFTILFTILCTVIISIIVITFDQILIEIFGITSNMILIVVTTAIAYALVMSLRAMYVSSLHTKEILIIFLISNVIRFAALIPVFLLDLGSEGITLAYTLFYLSATIMLLLARRELLFGLTKKKGYAIFSKSGEIVKASVMGWFPTVIGGIANQSGVLFIFGITGAAQAGIYYMAFGIFLAISALPQSVLTILFPIISGLKTGREELIWKAIKASLFIISPIVFAITFYPIPLLSIFGDEFTNGNMIMSLLSLSVIPTVLYIAFFFLSYSYGRYLDIIILGVIPNIIRLLLYILFVNDYGGEGIAASTLAGAVVGLIIAIIINHLRTYKIPSKEIFALIGIPSGIGGLLYLIEINEYIGIPAIIFVSYFIVTRLRVIKYVEVNEIVNSIFTEESNASKKLLYLAKLLFK